MTTKGAEATIVQFFMSAPPDAAFTLLLVAQALVSARGITSAGAWNVSSEPKPARAPRRKRGLLIDTTRLRTPATPAVAVSEA